MKPRAIKTEKDYDEVLSHIEKLMEMEDTSEVVEELELLATLVEVYEAKAYPMPAPDPIGAICFRMEQQELKQKDLIPFVGSKSKVSEVLSGKRSLSISMIRKLHEGSDIPLDVLLGLDSEPEALVAEETTDYGSKRNSC